MTRDKPHLKIIDGRTVAAARAEETPQVKEARRRFGQLFAHEPGSKWRPRSMPLLLEWLQGKGKA